MRIRSFLFWRDGLPAGRRARTLREFVGVVEQAPAAGLDGHLRRDDFSSWIANVFGGYPLANTVKRLENDYRAGNVRDIGTGLAQAIRCRYEFIGPEAKAANH